MARWAAAILAATALALPARPTVQDPPQESRTAYIRRMYATNRCTFGDAARAVAGLLGGLAADAPFTVVRIRLVDAKVLPESWDDAEGTQLTLGRLAYLLCGALDVKGGVSLSLFGRSQRYALRELIYIGIIERGVTDQLVSGRELIDVIRRSEVYKKDGSLDAIRR